MEELITLLIGFVLGGVCGGLAVNYVMNCEKTPTPEKITAVSFVLDIVVESLKDALSDDKLTKEELIIIMTRTMDAIKQANDSLNDEDTKIDDECGD